MERRRGSASFTWISLPALIRARLTRKYPSKAYTSGCVVCSSASTHADDNREGRLDQSLPRRRVLIVEDDCLIALFLTDEISELGYAVVGPVRNLAEATSIAATSVLDGALIDIALGEQSALPVATILSDRHIPFAFTTGDNEGPEEAFPDVPILGKPFTTEELRHALEALLGNNE